MQHNFEKAATCDYTDKELQNYLASTAKFYQREKNKINYGCLEELQNNEDIMTLRTNMISNLINWRNEYKLSFKQFELSVHIFDIVLSTIQVPVERMQVMAAISFFLSLKTNGDAYMTTTELLTNLEGKVESEDEIRELEMLVLNKLGWIVDIISPLETTRILMRKFFESKETIYDLDRVQGYLEGFILVATYDQQFLNYNYFEKGLITAFAFLDMIDAEECRQGFFEWIYKITRFPIDKIDTGRFLLIKTHLNDFEGTPVELVVKANLHRSLKDYLKQGEIKQNNSQYHNSPSLNKNKNSFCSSPIRNVSTFDNTPEQVDKSVISFNANKAVSFNANESDRIDDNISMIDERFEESTNFEDSGNKKLGSKAFEGGGAGDIGFDKAFFSKSPSYIH